MRASVRYWGSRILAHEQKNQDVPRRISAGEEEKRAEKCILCLSRWWDYIVRERERNQSVCYWSNNGINLIIKLGLIRSSVTEVTVPIQFVSIAKHRACLV